MCHRLGDLLCCETCPAVFHLECVDPPMEDVPEEDWQCSVCKAHKVCCGYTPLGTTDDYADINIKGKSGKVK